MEKFDKHAPKKTKIFQGSHRPHVNKILRKAIMKRSQLKNELNKTNDPKDILKFKKQHNHVLKLNNQSFRIILIIQTLSKIQSLFERAVSCTLSTSFFLS